MHNNKYVVGLCMTINIFLSKSTEMPLKLRPLGLRGQWSENSLLQTLNAMINGKL